MGYVAKEIWVGDCETDPFNSTTNIEPFLWGLYNPKHGLFKFRETHEFIEFVYQKEILVYFHNGGKFDYHFLLDYIEPFDKLLIIEGRISQFMIGAAEFRDSYNIFPMPLSAYKKDDIDYDIFSKENRHLPENWEAINKYFDGDLIYLHELVSAFISDYGRNLTIASAALKYWRKLYQIKNPKTSRLFFTTLKPFYYGGRVQCFHKGIINHEFKVVDINSAYPTAMQHKHPYGSIAIGDESLPETTEEIQRAFIDLDCVSKGAFPFRNKDGGLDFPADGERRNYKITGWEYIKAKELGLVSEIKINYVYTLPETIEFNGYVSHFYQLKTAAKYQKENGKTPEEKSDGTRRELFAKLMLNSLYGKFALNVDKFKNNMLVPRDDIGNGIEYENFDFICYLGNELALMEKEVDENEMRDFLNIAVSASITGWVRAYMLDAICSVDMPLYCDTDSIACRDTGKLELDAYTLGAWDLEGVFKQGGIAGKKMYAFLYADDWDSGKKKGKAKTACKGVRLTPEQILRVAAGEEITARNIAPTYSLKKEPYIMERTVRIT